MSDERPSGLRTFIIVWIGQVLSIFGSAMTGFGLSIWAWQITGQVTALALAATSFTAATMLASPLAGVLVDRWNRKAVIIVADAAAALSTAVLLVLYATGQLQIWHLYVANAFSGLFQALHWPAYSAAITMIVPKKHYARTSGMLSLAEAASGIVSPVLAAALLGLIGLAGIMAVDLATMALAVGVLLLVRIPQPERSAAGREGQGGFLREAAYGFRYIFQRRSLLALQLVFFFGNLISALGFTAIAPMILARTGDNAMSLGTVQTVAGVGMLAGSLLVSVWGGFRRKVHGVLLGWILSSLLGAVVFGLGRSLLVWAAAGLLYMFFMPLVNASNQAIWQAKVAPDVQGRVFSVRRLIAQFATPLATLAAGVLADRVFEPGMMAGGPLASLPLLADLFGTARGSGMALMVTLGGLLGIVGGLVPYAIRIIRDVEVILPDHALAEVPAAASPMPGEGPAQATDEGALSAAEARSAQATGCVV